VILASLSTGDQTMARTKSHTPEQVGAVVKELEEQTDRGCAIIGAALMDEAISVVLQNRMIELNREHYDAVFGLHGPAGSLSNKIELFYALGLCNERLYRAMHDVRAIRNKFAHRIEPLTFEDPDIAKMVDNITYFAEETTDRRTRFNGLLGIVIMFIIATGTPDDIRLKSMGETHSQIYLALLKMLFPNNAAEIEKTWQNYKDGEAS